MGEVQGRRGCADGCAAVEGRAGSQTCSVAVGRLGFDGIIWGAGG